MFAYASAPGWSAAFDSIFFIIFLYFCAVSIFQCSLFCVLNISDSLFLVLRDSASPNSRKKPHAAARDNVSDRMSSDRQLNTEIWEKRRRQRRVWTWVTSQLKPHSEKVAAHCFHLEYQTWTSRHHILKCTKLSLWQTKTWKSHWLWLIDRPHKSITQKLCNFECRASHSMLTFEKRLKRDAELPIKSALPIFSSLPFPSLKNHGFLDDTMISWLAPLSLAKSTPKANHCLCAVGSLSEKRLVETVKGSISICTYPVSFSSKNSLKTIKIFQPKKGELCKAETNMSNQNTQKKLEQNRIKIRNILTKNRVFRNLSNGGLLQGPQKIWDPQVLFPPPFFFGGGGVAFLFFVLQYFLFFWAHSNGANRIEVLKNISHMSHTQNNLPHFSTIGLANGFRRILPFLWPPQTALAMTCWLMLSIKPWTSSSARCLCSWHANELNALAAHRIND